MRRCLTSVVFVAAMSSALPALAQDPNCPPGAWFCAEAEPAPAGTARPAPTPKTPAMQPAPEEPVDEAPAEPPRTHATQPPPTQPPVVIYQPVPMAPPPRVIVVSPGYTVRPIPPAPAAPPPMAWRSEFGLNLRVQGLILGHAANASPNAGMGGVGLSLRYRPIPHFAFDFGIDFLAGNDYNGFERKEMPLTLNGILFVNPRSRVQFYLIGGLNYAHATVHADGNSYAGSVLLRPDGDGYSGSYSYFGGQGGAGLEFRLAKHVALNIDALGFLRKRIDDTSVPEYVDWNTGKTTNASGGGLLRGGITFWW